MSRFGRPLKTTGTVYPRLNTKYLWARYRNREGRIIKESTGTTNQEEAERFLRDRLDARDEGRLPAILAGKRLTFDQWADWFLEHRSKPPYRAEKTHQENLKVLKLLRPVFGSLRLSEITPEGIEEHMEIRLQSRKRIHTKFGVQYAGRLKPATVHQEFRVLRRILNPRLNPSSGGNTVKARDRDLTSALQAWRICMTDLAEASKLVWKKLQDRVTCFRLPASTLVQISVLNS